MVAARRLRASFARIARSISPSPRQMAESADQNGENGPQDAAKDEAGAVDHAALLSALIASTSAMRSPIQRMTGTAIELPSAL